MSKKKTFAFSLNNKELKIQIGELADQASGCCLMRYGDTSILCTAQLGAEKPEMGFFPLTCDYEERFYAAGKILGSRFMRREGRPSAEAVLISRMIDRAVRPLFPAVLKSEIQVIATCLSWDSEKPTWPIFKRPAAWFNTLIESFSPPSTPALATRKNTFPCGVFAMKEPS